MRSGWIAGFSGLVLAWSVACGGDAATGDATGSGASSTGGTTSSSTSTGGGGMAAGPSTTSTSSGGNSAGGSSAGGTGGFATSCEEACAKVDMCAGLPGTCGLIGVDCNDPMADCPALCINAADCAAITSLVGQNADPTLSACLDMCGGGGGAGGGGGGGPSTVACGICTAQNCQSQAQACQGVASCQTYAQCANACTDSTCEAACLASNPSTEATNLSTCVCGSCSADCAGCQAP